MTRNEMWKKTLALAVELPFDTTEEEIWSKLVKRHPKYTEFFITATTTLDIFRLPYIGYSFMRWFLKNDGLGEDPVKNFSAIQSEFLQEFRRRLITEYPAFTTKEEEQFEDNYANYKEKLKGSSETYKIFKTSFDFLANVDQEIIAIKEEENDP